MIFLLIECPKCGLKARHEQLSVNNNGRINFQCYRCQEFFHISEEAYNIAIEEEVENVRGSNKSIYM